LGRQFIIWVNFLETLFHYGVHIVKDYIIRLLREGAPGDGVIIEMDEDASSYLLEEAFTAIVETIEKYGKYLIKL
jgi:hypothetical protein